MAGTIIVSNIKTDTDNSFIVRSNTGATLFSVDSTSISIPDGSITSAMIANGTVIAADVADGSITDAKITAVANTKITGLITSGQIANVANTKITGLVTSGQIANVANTQITGLVTAAQIANVANTQITGVLTGGQLANTAVTAGVYGGATQIPAVTIDAQGRITSASNVAFSSTPTTQQVLDATAGASAGAVGTYMFAKYGAGLGTITFGSTTAGSNLVPTSAGGTPVGSAQSGTWRAMGTSNGSDTGDRASTLFLRTA